jgi:RimJ/RimL family protein N-acetyltransferase
MTIHPGLETPARLVDDEPATRTLVLRSGVQVPVREIRPSDAPALQRFHSRLSALSVFRRFLHPMPRLDDAGATYFTELDGINRHALVALDPHQRDEISAVVRYDRDPGSDQAEYAIVVADPWQHQGLGRALTTLLIDDARANGIRVLYAYVLPENRPMSHLFQDLGLPFRVRREDPTLDCIELDLRGGTTDRPAPQ